jgi:GT2 family glycosyltransferase
VVVDDGSADDTLEIVRNRRAKAGYLLRLVEQSHAGPAAARNRGVEAAHGTLIVFLDDDVAPRPDLIEAHVMTHAAKANLVVTGPMSPPGDWPRPSWVRWEEQKLESQYRAMLEGQWECTARQFYTGNASVARDFFLAAGGFDTRFGRAEDVELGYRMHDLGARFVFNPRAEVLHFASRTFESWRRTPYQYGRYDVVMQRDKGQHTLEWAMSEFHSRNLLNRSLVKLCAGRRPISRALERMLTGIVRIADDLGARSLCEKALSAMFSVLYWQGVCDEFGDRRALWHAVAASARAH